jgi:hypothetical protein
VGKQSKHQSRERSDDLRKSNPVGISLFLAIWRSNDTSIGSVRNRKQS